MTITCEIMLENVFLNSQCDVDFEEAHSELLKKNHAQTSFDYHFGQTSPMSPTSPAAPGLDSTSRVSSLGPPTP